MTPQRLVLNGVALETDPHAAGTGVTFCFTQRAGGVSPEPWSSLNLGGLVGDDPKRVRENRRRVLAALGAADLERDLVVPRQVHGNAVALIEPDGGQAPSWVRQGCDAVVCTRADVPVLLVFADCVPVVLVAPGGFAVAHSGWRGTRARISAKAAIVLARACGVAISEVSAYIGPHIGAAAYEVSPELCAEFAREFGAACVPCARHLDLERAVRATLEQAGVARERIAACGQSTFENVDRYFSFRAEHGRCGRHGALAFMRAR